MSFPNRVYALMADILRFPSAELLDRTRECIDLVSRSEVVSQARGSLRDFLVCASDQPREWLEEVYTRTFELSPVCYPYVGYHLFGDTHKRAAFMVVAKQRLVARGILPGNELPDHLCFFLEFLATADDDAAAGELIQECLLPTVRKMTESFNKAGKNPYSKVFYALLHILERDKRTNTVKVPGGAV